MRQITLLPPKMLKTYEQKARAGESHKNLGDSCHIFFVPPRQEISITLDALGAVGHVRRLSQAEWDATEQFRK